MSSTDKNNIDTILSIMRQRQRATLFLFQDKMYGFKNDEGKEKLQAYLDELVSNGTFTFTPATSNGQPIKMYRFADSVCKKVSNNDDGNASSSKDDSSDGSEQAETENAATPQQQISKPKYIIDPGFRRMFTEKTKEEYEELKEAIRNEGCRDPLVVWDEKGYLLDGHNRDRICGELGIEPLIVRMSFEDRLQATMWIVQNQFSRRNLNTFQRIEAALSLKAHYKSMAKQNQKAAGGAVPLKSRKPVETDDEIAKLAKTSADTVWKVEKILPKMKIEELNALRNDEDGISINSVFQKYYGKEKGKDKKEEKKEKNENEKKNKKEKQEPVTSPPASSEASDDDPLFDLPSEQKETTPEPATPQNTKKVATPTVSTSRKASVEKVAPSSSDLEREMNKTISNFRREISHHHHEDRPYVLRRLQEFVEIMEEEWDNITPQE